MVSLLLMASSRVMLLPASCLSTSAFFLHFPAKILNFSRQISDSNSINHLQLNYLFHLCLLPAFAPKFLIFPAKTQIQIRSINYSLTIPSLPFTCVRAKILNFSRQNSDSNSINQLQLNYFCLLPPFATKFQIFSLQN